MAQRHPTRAVVHWLILPHLGRQQFFLKKCSMNRLIRVKQEEDLHGTGSSILGLSRRPMSVAYFRTMQLRVPLDRNSTLSRRQLLCGRFIVACVDLAHAHGLQHPRSQQRRHSLSYFKRPPAEQHAANPAALSPTAPVAPLICEYECTHASVTSHQGDNSSWNLLLQNNHNPNYLLFSPSSSSMYSCCFFTVSSAPCPSALRIVCPAGSRCFSWNDAISSPLSFAVSGLLPPSDSDPDESDV